VMTSTTEFDPGSQVDQAVASLVGVLQAVASAGIWFAIVWLPILIVLGILAVVVMFILRRFSRSSGGPDAPAAPAAPAAPTAESGA
jgi:flagellar basal body-associated protein FliL